jgi:hypothetical protein
MQGECLPRTAEKIHAGDYWGRRLDRVSYYLRFHLMLLLGITLVTYSLLVTKAEAFPLLTGEVRWITAEYGLGQRFSVAAFLLTYLGRFIYVASLLLAACTVVLLVVFRFSAVALRNSRVAAALGLLAYFLAICSITDYYFSWISFLLEGNLPFLHWILFLFFLLHWLVPLLFAAAVIGKRRSREQTVDQELKIVIVFYTPLLLFDVAMTPFFVSNFFVSPFFPAAFLGLQFLAWGYLALARTGFP